MIKGLEALKNIHNHWNCCNPNSNGCDEDDFAIVETALKEFEDLQKVLDDFHIYNVMNLIDTLRNIQFLDKRIANLEYLCEKHYDKMERDSKELKALEVIKEKKVDVDLFLKSTDREMYNMVFESWNRPKDFQLTQEEFDLLREVLL